MVSAPTYRKIHSGTEQVAGCSTGKKAKTTQCANGDAGYGFLKHRFLPVRENKYALLQNRKAVDGEFFASLSNLAELYEFTPPDVSQQPYPVNIAIAYCQAKAILKIVSSDIHLIIVNDDNHIASLATVTVYNTGTTLYYIPVRPLYDLIKSGQNKQEVQLILSIFAYLYHIAKIPYYRDCSTYLFYCYDAISEWYLDSGEWDKEDYKENIRHLKTLRKGGDSIRKKMNQAIHLNQFEKRLKTFIPSGDTEIALLELATTAFDLMQTYPGRSIFDSIPESLIDPETDERITADRYLSFFWDSEDNIYDSLMEYVNSDLQEYGVIDEPVSMQFFDVPQDKPYHNLQFENKLFGLIENLCTVLNKLA